MIVKENVSLKLYCTYQIGGVAEKIYFPESEDELVSLLSQFGGRENCWVLGWGANVIFQEGTLKRPVVCTRGLSTKKVTENTIEASAGILLDELVRIAVENSLGGVEALSGIPGTVGGALYMNAGAYGAEISDYLLSVRLLLDGKVVTLEKDECGFGYRQALALQEGVVLSAKWSFPSECKDKLSGKRDEILRKRREKQPLDYPSGGSVFKRPVGNYASKLIDEAGLRGTRVGGAEVSEKHAGFIVNKGGATCDDVLALVEICQKKVKAEFGYDLKMEQKLFIE